MPKPQRLIDTAALRHNWQVIRRRAKSRKLMAVVKTNAYGHGLTQTVAALADDADAFALSQLADAVIIRNLGITKPILLMSGVDNKQEMAQAIVHNLWLTVYNKMQIKLIAELPANSKLTVFLKTNTGMGRLGIASEEAAAAQATLAANPAVSEVVLMTHFASADTPNGLCQPLTIINSLRHLFTQVSLCNSAAALLHDDINDDWGRVGIALYGSSPAPQWQDRNTLRLHPVMTFSAPVINLQRIKAGDSMGYGNSWTASENTPVGIISVGYANGYPRSIKDGYVTINGRKAAIIGRVSMEMTALDLSTAPETKINDTAIMWGDEPSIDEIATAADTISYDLLTRNGERNNQPQ